MSTRKKSPSPRSGSTPPPDDATHTPDVALSSSRSTVAGPAESAPVPNGAPAALQHARDTQLLAEAFPFNPNKADEYGAAAREPRAGIDASDADSPATGSTLSEANASTKTGGRALAGENAQTDTLERVRSDDGGRVLTTNQGVAVADNQNSLKAGLRGPTLLEDFILREKITHFDHERIPERVVHARGSAAHGVFEVYESLSDITSASLFAEAGKQTPVFVRFSTVIGERGSADTVRDVRGFAVKFYTDAGNWDLVGNNMPVFFIQDAMKFPDLVHAAKPEPHFAMPQASTAHDTLWDFVSLMPESTHMLLWAMSDRAIPRSYRTMQGFGVHTFRLVNARGESHFVKFHWIPQAGTHSLVWDEAAKISGADPDFHRRDLWEAIEAGHYPAWELGLQVFSEEDAERFSFDVLDATKLIPEEMVPIRLVGKMTLNRNPDNFFAETEQVAFCTAHLVPGLDFSNDPLLAGRIHSYVDTQISRLGGANFHEIPINAPLAPVHNNQRDGAHRQAIPRGRVNYEPNSLGGGCPFQAGAANGYASLPAEVQGDKLRGKPERFAEHYAQATLFWNSQRAIEQLHIADAFRFELTRVQTPAIRARVVAMLVNVDMRLATMVADGLGLPVPDGLPLPDLALRPPEVQASPSLSLFARPGDGRVDGRRVAILVTDGVDRLQVIAAHRHLLDAGAVPRVLARTLGAVISADGVSLQPEASFDTLPSVLFDAVLVPEVASAPVSRDSREAIAAFVKEQVQHCKPVLLVGAAQDWLACPPAAVILHGAPTDLDAALTDFTRALAAHRNFDDVVAVAT